MDNPLADETVPIWLATVVAAIFGGGGVKMLSVWLENRRLNRDSFRQMLTQRIQHVEEENERLQRKVTSLASENARLESEMKQNEKMIEQLQGEIKGLQST